MKRVLCGNPGSVPGYLPEFRRWQSHLIAFTANYVEARTADVYTGPCFANSEVGLTGQLAVFGWKVTKGSWDGVQLDDLGVVGVVRASSTLGDVYHTAYPVKAVLIVDERANPEQRLALQSFAKRMGGDLLQDVVRVEYQPIDLTLRQRRPAQHEGHADRREPGQDSDSRPERERSYLPQRRSMVPAADEGGTRDARIRDGQLVSRRGPGRNNGAAPTSAALSWPAS